MTDSPDTRLGSAVAGVDEVGRGPLAGPVVAAAVILDPGRPITDIRDSKLMTPGQRSAVAEAIKAQAVAWAVGRAEVEEIDRLNILEASLVAMRRAVHALGRMPAEAWVDGNKAPALDCPVRLCIGGDGLHACIGAASILAKVTRDAEMVALAARFPEYGFERHKGYGTKEHLAALNRYGPSPLHRRSFAPVRALIDTLAGG